MSRGKRVTLEDRKQKVEEVLKKYPNATRSKITQWTGYKGKYLDELYEAGVKIPKKNPTKSTTTSWMKHIGSLSGRRD